MAPEWHQTGPAVDALMTNSRKAECPPRHPARK